MLSVIIPVFNEEEIVQETFFIIQKILNEEKIEHEIIMVDDGSKDASWQKIESLTRSSKHVRGIKFSKNFGKESAIFAGMHACSGECCVVIDCDLQHPPEKIIEMYTLWEDGYEIVEGVKSERGKESFIHSLAAKMFYYFMSEATGIDMRRASDFKLLDRKAINVLINMPEKNAFFRALSSWIGFRSIQIEYIVKERQAGKSKWSTWMLIKYAVTNVTSFTAAPMQLVTILGLLVFMVGVIFSILALWRWGVGMSVEGFTTVIILQCITSSIIMISIGIIGYYIEKMYDEIKGRPKYIIEKES